MPTQFFKVSSHKIIRRTVSLLPDVTKIVNTSRVHFVEHVTKDQSVESNFSVGINLIALARVTNLVTMYRKHQPYDPDALEWLMDVIDGKRHITDEDLQDYSKALTPLTDTYNKRHTHQNTKNNQ